MLGVVHGGHFGARTTTPNACTQARALHPPYAARSRRRDHVRGVSRSPFAERLDPLANRAPRDVRWRSNARSRQAESRSSPRNSSARRSKPSRTVCVPKPPQQRWALREAPGRDGRRASSLATGRCRRASHAHARRTSRLSSTASARHRPAPPTVPEIGEPRPGPSSAHVRPSTASTSWSTRGSRRK